MSQAFSALNLDLIAAIERGDTILAPTRSASYRLKFAYAQHAMSQGLHSWRTPAITSFDGWIEKLWRSHLHDVSTLRVLNDQQAQLAWDCVVRDSKWSETLLNPQAAARSSFRSWQRMIAWQISRDDLLSYVSTNENAECSALIDWHDAFIALCRAKQWLPTALLPEQLLAAKTSSVFSQQRVVTIGGDLRPIELKLLQHAVACGSTWLQLEPSIVANPTDVVVAESLSHEFSLAAHWADEQLTLGKSAIGIAVSNLERYAAPIERAFAEVFAQNHRTLGLPSTSASFSIAAHRSLSEFPIVRSTLDILSLCTGRAPSTLAGIVLRSPYVGGNESEAGARALTDAQLRNQTREHYSLLSLARIAAENNCDVLEKRLSAAHDLLRVLPARLPPSVLAEVFVAIWQTFGWPGDSPLTSDEQQLVSRVHEALGEFGALDDLVGPMSLQSAVREFEQLVTSIRFSPRALPTAISIVDVDAIDGLAFDALWVTGMDANRWPPAAEPDPLIPIELQLRANMPFASATHTREAASQRFAQLRSIAPQVTMSWSRHDADIELSPSPWLKALPTHTADAPTSDSYADVLFDKRPTLEVCKEVGAPVLTTSRVRGGTRIFELQSLCPFRAQAELRLRATPLDQVAPSIDARERGTLIHAALADIWRELRDSNGLHARSSDQLANIVRTALGRHVASLLEGVTSYRVRMLQIEVELAAQRILELLAIDSERQPFKVVGHPETPEQKRVGPLNIELRLDRVDETIANDQAEATRIVIDYKTGSLIEANSWYSTRPTQPQLPLYAITHPESLGAVAFATLSAKSIRYYGVAKTAGLLPNVREFDRKKLPPPHVEWTGLLNYWQEVIEALANDYGRGIATVDPTPTACRYCHLASLCRINELTNPALRAALDEEGVA